MAYHITKINRRNNKPMNYFRKCIKEVSILKIYSLPYVLARRKEFNHVRE